jgi:hypothetical protein
MSNRVNKNKRAKSQLSRKACAATRKKPSESQKTRVTFSVPDKLYAVGRAYAAARGISLAALVRGHLTELANRVQKKRTPRK